MTKLCEALESSRYAFGKDVFVDGFTYFNAQERAGAGELPAAGSVCHCHAAGGSRTARRR